MPPELHFDPAKVDLGHVLADRVAVEAVNPQRFEMQHLDAIVLLDPVQHLCIGYKEVRDNEFWVRGHMPGYPLLPGVIMCEAAAQLCSYYVIKTDQLMSGDFIGFSGMENVRFRGTVKPGDRLLLVCKALKIHRRQMVFNVQGFVKNTMVFHGDIIGVPLSYKNES